MIYATDHLVTILDKGSRDPDSTDAAEAKLVAQELHLIDESLN